MTRLLPLLGLLLLFALLAWAHRNPSPVIFGTETVTVPEGELWILNQE
jgi:hypothetical protein